MYPTNEEARKGEHMAKRVDVLLRMEQDGGRMELTEVWCTGYDRNGDQVSCVQVHPGLQFSDELALARAASLVAHCAQGELF